MASHHHHHHHPTTTCCCTCNCCQPSAPPPLAPPHAGAILQAMASLLLQQQPQPSQKSHLFGSPHKQPNLVHRRKSHSYGYTQDDIFGVLSSLLARIDALEASLQQLSSPPSAFKSHPFCSLRDAAARVIQTHFRAFLVRRLKTLRQLKELAIVKSRFNSLNLSISGEAQLNSDSVHQEALDLLLKLDSIQGGDPMIRDGKESLRRGLVQLLDYINGASGKEHRVLLRASKNVRLSGDKSRFRAVSSDHREQCSSRGVSLTKSRNRVGEACGQSRVFRDEAGDVVELEGFHQVIGGAANARNFMNGKGDACVTKYRNGAVVKGPGGRQPTRVKKSVSFAKNGTLYTVSPSRKTGEVSSSADGTVTDESVSSDDHGGVDGTTDSIRQQIGGLAIAKDMEGEESPGSSDEESNMATNLTGFVENEEHLVQDENFMFAAPLPVKMESRADLLKKRKGVTFNIVS